MLSQDALMKTDIVAYLNLHEQKSLLRFITCGSVDDGKSTLIGRLLYDSQLIFEDQLAAIETDSRKLGTQGEGLDLALLVDGLAAEREQGITIDVAYRFFSTDKRKFIVADTPGHEQYTRNMATGASTAEVAILLIDARYGVQVQTRRHAYIASLLGIKHVVIAVNKMDLIEYSQSDFNDIEVEFRRFAEPLGFLDIECIPVSALKGDNVTRASEHMKWYKGPTLLSYLEDVDVTASQNEYAFRLPVQWVNRPNLDFRGYSGTIVSGQIKTGQEIYVSPSGLRSRVKDIVTYDKSRDLAREGMAVTITLDDELDISRGDVICQHNMPAEAADQFQVKLIWMAESDMFPGRQYRLKFHNQSVSGAFTNLKHRINVNDMSEDAATTLELNDIGVCTLGLSAPIAFDPYEKNRHMGGFIVIDRHTNQTVGAGMIEYALRRARNVLWQKLDVNQQARAEQKHQKPVLLWFTGLSGSGKSTIANLVEKRLLDIGRHTYTLDGDNIRHGLNRDLGFTKADRIENIRRIGEVSRLMVDAGLITIASFISPYRAERDSVRQLLGEAQFIEIFVDTPLEVCEARDVKGLYKRARAGEIKNFTGIDSEYQVPETPELCVNTMDMTAEAAAEFIVEYLRKHDFLES